MSLADDVWAAPEPVDGAAVWGSSADLTPARFLPVPVVAINGVDVASGAAGPGDGLMVVDGLRVKWGREADEILDQPDPATGSLTLFDATRTWATSADRRGLPVTIRYQGTAPDGSTVSAVYFRGRIGAPVRVVRRDVHRRVDGELVRGSLVSVPLQSALVDLANITSRFSWPLETMGARFDRIVGLAQLYGHLTGGGALRDYWRVPEVAPVPAKDQADLLESLVDCFDSAGADTYTYRPSADAVVNVERREILTVTYGRLWWDGTDPTQARAGQGAYVRAINLNPMPWDASDGPGLYLDAASLEYDPGDGLTSPPRITRVALTHPSDQDSYNDRTVEVPVQREPFDPAGGHAPLDERTLGVRAARADSIIAWTHYADLAASDTERLVRREGSRWQLAPLRLSTRRTGGFETVAQAQLLLGGSRAPVAGVPPAVGPPRARHPPGVRHQGRDHHLRARRLGRGVLAVARDHRRPPALADLRGPEHRRPGVPDRVLGRAAPEGVPPLGDVRGPPVRRRPPVRPHARGDRPR